MVLLDILEKIEDPRSYHGKEYKLHHILLFTILALLSGANTYTGIQVFISTHYLRLKEIFKLRWRQPPLTEAIRRILIRLDPDEVEVAFREHSSLMDGDDGEREQRHICFDGKTLNGSFSRAKNQRATRVFNVFSICNEIVLAHLPLNDDKDHEIPALQRFLLELNLNGVVVTADALHCQKKLLSAQSMQEQS
jgi:hypothetical protein